MSSTRSSTHASATPDRSVRSEEPPHLDTDPREVAVDGRRVAVDELKVDQGNGKIRMRRDRTRVRPQELAALLGPRSSRDGAAAEKMHEEVEASGGSAPDLVAGDRPELVDGVACLFEKLAPRGVLDPFVPLDVPARQEPRAREWAGGLLHDEDASSRIDAADHGADPRAFAHGRYGFFGVGVGKGGSVGGPPGVRVGTGVRVGRGVSEGEGVAQASGPTRFQV